MQLRDYQLKIKNFIINTPRCNIFVKCGMGKTFSTLAAINELKIKDFSSFPILIVAPKKVAENEWEEQAKKAGLSNLTFSKILGSPAQRIKALNIDADIYIINYELLNWFHMQIQQSKIFKFNTIICDESTKIKNHRVSILKNNKMRISGAVQAKSIVRYCRHVKRWINLSGTPISNSLEDIWGQQFPIDGGKALGRTFTHFIEKYFNQIIYNYNIIKNIPKKNSEKSIMFAIKNNTILINSTHKDPIIIDIHISLDNDNKKEYKKLEKNKIIEINNSFIEDFAGMKERQYASGTLLDRDGHRHLIHNKKLEALKVLVDNLKTNVIVSYYFKHDADIIMKSFPQAVRLDKGGVDAINGWNNNKISMLLIHPQSAGHGLNLQYGGNIIIIYSADWNSELSQQIIERIGQARQRAAGFNRDTYVYRLIIKDTIESSITNRVDNKMVKSDSTESYLSI